MTRSHLRASLAALAFALARSHVLVTRQTPVRRLRPDYHERRAHAEPALHHVPREKPWGWQADRAQAAAEPNSLTGVRGLSDYAEPLPYKQGRAAGLDRIGASASSCFDQCTWLRAKLPPLWAETRGGGDEECTAARVWFENGCWHDGVPAWPWRNEHYEQRPVVQYQVRPIFFSRSRSVLRNALACTDACSRVSCAAAEARGHVLGV